ncbi:MAG: methionine synthase [Prevotella sp.]|nr:methionine synthase [Prevotella sp.]MBO5156533.1 methionine synthase [Prevotella sp.]
MVETTLTYDDLAISPSMIYEQMGYGSSVPDADVQAEVDSILQQIRKILRPRYAFFIAEGVLDDDTNMLTLSHNLEGTNVSKAFSSSGTFSVGRIISRQLRGSRQFVVFVCTSGMTYQMLHDRLTEEGDMVRLFVADAIGSVIAERTADCMQAEVAAYIAGRGYKNTNRFSPGYCGWHVSEQRRLFSLFPQSAPCGVTLTDSCLMIPIKSVSGVIGIGSSVRCLDYSCGLCDMKQCYKRRARGIAENQ